MKRIEAPEIDKNDNIAPEVSKHLGDNTESSGKWTCESIFVLVNNHKAFHLSDLITKNIHQLFNKLCISLILEFENNTYKIQINYLLLL